MPSLPVRHGSHPPALRRKTAERGYDADWRKLRCQFLRENPLCVECLKRQEVKESQEVDHIVPISRGGPRLEWSNLQALCKSCHSRKTFRETRA